MTKKSGILVALVSFLALAGLVLYFIDNRTGFSSEDVSKGKGAAVRENDFNAAETEGSRADLAELRPTELIVPEKYRSGVFSSRRILNAPENFSISVFASGFGSPRAIAFFDENTLFATDRANGNLYFLNDADGDGSADEIKTVDPDLQNAHGVDVYKGDLYVGEEHQIVVYRGVTGEGGYREKQVLIPNLPSGKGHVTRTVKVGPDEKIYVAIGSSCNVCEEDDQRRAAVLRYNLDGSLDRTIATGLRNTVDFTFRERESGFELWGVDNGRDRIGDNIPPEEVNLIYSENQAETKNFGWPYCYGDGEANPEFPARADYCRNETEFPRFNMQAHSAPLGMVFGAENSILNGRLLVAFHGSWNRSVPTGYKIVELNLETGETRDFISGWLENNRTVWGRPVDVKISSDGKIFITDDEAGAIYVIKSLKAKF